MLTFFKAMGIMFVVALAAVIVDCGFLYYQASTGKSLPFKLNIYPKFGGKLLT